MKRKFVNMKGITLNNVSFEVIYNLHKVGIFLKKSKKVLDSLYKRKIYTKIHGVNMFK